MRWLLIGVLAGVLMPAWAQTDDSRQFDAARKADLQNWEWRARQGRLLGEADKAVQAVTDAVMQRDCSGAVSRLNAGLSKAYPEVLVLAGAMYEDGICLKPNWDRAAGFYQRAFTAGHPGAAARMAAGFAAPAGGRDKAAALWWALQAKTALPAACTQVAPLADDADRFVAALKAWPAGQVDACAYVAAIMAAIQSEVEAPGLAAAFGLVGTVRFVFLADQARIDIAEDLAPTVPVSLVIDAAVQERDAKTARMAFSAALRQLADRALRRYERPAAMATGWRVEGSHALRLAR